MSRLKPLKSFVHGLLTGAAGLTLAGIGADQAQAQAYGPRIFLPAPSGTNAVNFQIINIDSNTSFDASIVYPDLNIDTDAFVFSYVRNFELGGTSGQVVITQPIAIVDIGVTAGNLGISRGNTGLADTQVELRVGILGAPAADIPEYVQYLTEENPDVVIKGLVGVTFPTGDYSTSQIVNIGSNRFAFRVGLPTTINLGPNWAPGNRTLLEVIPAANFYTSNNSPPFPNSQFGSDFNSQNPLFTLETHFSHDLGPRFFASIDGYFVTGGATSSNGVGNNNAQSWLGAGGVPSVVPCGRGGTLTVSYGGVVARNENSPDGAQIKLFLLQAF
ncbi:MAG: transporter [Leptolyngbyaceae cyanobacterium SM2_3_12]|nr:transporter [Leptolyngbyaceae cyanobacterium SM2_3_12]